MKKKIIISICSRSFNPGLLSLLKSISKNSILNEFKTIILIVINNKKKISNSQKKKIKKSLNKKIFKIIYESREGVSYARNKSLNLMKKIKFNYGCFLDDDCVIKKNYFEENLLFIKKNKCDVVTGPQINISKKIHHKIFERNFDNRKQLAWASTNNVFFKKKIIINKLNFSEKVTKFGFGEDQLFFLNISKKGYSIIWNKNSKVYENKKNQKEKLNWFIDRNLRYGLTGKLIDYEFYGNKIGFFVNLLKIIINIFFSLISISKILSSPIQNFYFFMAYILRSIGRFLCIFLKN